MTPIIRVVLAASLAATVVAPALAGQGIAAGTGGAAQLAQEQRLSGNWRRVLMIGAHPDDEDTELLTILSRGLGIETAYLSLSRGDGGQNLIGAELGVSLGVLRTEELNAARAIDGGRQFFARAFDFGFSKTATETFQFWDRDSLVKDVVRIIRRFRPQVIISAWAGTPADGHGHHQASGMIARDAFHAAGDSTRFPELRRQEGLKPWQPAKFYLARNGSGPALEFDGGMLDPAVGQSMHQIAMRSRSAHRSQNQGRLQDLGPSRARMNLVERAPGITGNDDSLFAGIPREAPPVDDPHRAAAQFIASGIVIDATTDDDEVVPGQLISVTLTIWNAGHALVAVYARPIMRSTWAFMMPSGDACMSITKPLAPGAVITCTYSTRVSPAARPTTPYYLREPSTGAMFTWSGDPGIRGDPFEPPELQAEFGLQVGGVEYRVLREVQGRFLDPVLGEVRRPLAVVPRVAVELTPDRMLWPLAMQTHLFVVALEHLARDTTTLSVALKVPAGWKTSAAQTVHFAGEAERATVRFTVQAPRGATIGPNAITATVLHGADSMPFGVYRIRYPHVRDRNIITRAASTAVLADVKFADRGTVGYVRGGGDRVPEALMNSGLSVKLLTGDELERGSLAQFHVIIIGPRAYEIDESLKRANARLMRWTEAGGTLIVEYQQTPYVRGGFAPRPLNIGTPTQSRVTEENAAVTILAKLHPVLRTPNVIHEDDFEHWVQERGLDFPSTWDPAWTPILEMHDTGDTPRPGGLLIARVGKGTAVYTGLSFFRQLPAAVPGAWRLFANILALGAPVRVGGK